MTSHSPSPISETSVLYPPREQIDALIAQAQGLRTQAIRQAFYALGRLVWRIWTAGIRDPRPAKLLPSGPVAYSGCD